MAIIRQLKNFFTKQVIYPKTLTKAVYDENGERLDKILRDTMLATDNEEYNGVEPRDADTLGGRIKASDIDKLQSDVSGLLSGVPIKQFPAYKNKRYYISLDSVDGTSPNSVTPIGLLGIGGSSAYALYLLKYNACINVASNPTNFNPLTYEENKKFILEQSVNTATHVLLIGGVVYKEEVI